MYWIAILIIIIEVILPPCFSMPVMPADSPMDMAHAMKYLEHYGYLGEKMPLAKYRKMAETDMDSAVTMAFTFFQRRYRRFGLNVTGTPDIETMKLMNKSRCGNEDLMTIGDMMKRKKRYMLYGSKWNKNDLTYRISQYPRDRDMSDNDVNYEIMRAFKVWEAVSPLRFTKLPSTTQVDFDIQFVPTVVDHGDGSPFDGAGGTLAHAFFPTSNPIGGDSHFDEAETWTLNTANGINLFQVAAHEFGHALGLKHSEDPVALMAPFYSGYNQNFVLPDDDRRGIQALYGSETTTTTIRSITNTATTEQPPTTKQPTTPPPSMADVCSNARFDAITTLINNGEYKTYAFQGDLYFQLNESGIVSSYPRRIKYGWPGLPDNIDAALFWDAVYEEEWQFNVSTNRWKRQIVQKEPSATFIFKGAQYWRVEDMKVVGDPKSIAQWGIPSNIDAAFVWEANGKTYFIKDNQYYGYTKNVGIGLEYPKLLSSWGNNPKSVDAAIPGEPGQTFFFSGTQFYVYNDTTYQVDEVKDIASYWLKCQTTTSAAVKLQTPPSVMILALFFMVYKTFL